MPPKPSPTSDDKGDAPVPMTGASALQMLADLRQKVKDTDKAIGSGPDRVAEKKAWRAAKDELNLHIATMRLAGMVV